MFENCAHLSKRNIHSSHVCYEEDNSIKLQTVLEYL